MPAVEHRGSKRALDGGAWAVAWLLVGCGPAHGPLLSGDPDGGAAGTTAGSGGLAGTTAADGPEGTTGAPPSDSAGGQPRLDVEGATGGDAGQGCSFIDVLFVVDISASMRQERENLKANAPGFVQVLDDLVADPGRRLTGYRIGVTNSTIVDNGAGGDSTLGLDGRLYGGGGGGFFGCDDTFDPPWIDGPGNSVAADLNCLVDTPVSGPSGTDVGKERPLDALEYFISGHGPGGPNDGFYRRDEALFVVVNLTDEDDDEMYSTTTPDQTKARLDEFVQGEERVVVVTVAGPQDHSCDSDFGSASPAPVLHGFTGSVPNGLMGDICEGDLAKALADALALIQISCDVLPPPVG